MLNPDNRQTSYPAWMLFDQTSGPVSTLLERPLQKLGLTTLQAAILSAVGSRPDCTQEHLARLFGCESNSLCQVLRRMENTGLIRETRAEDRDAHLHVTYRGLELSRQAQLLFAACDVMTVLLPPVSEQFAEQLPALRTSIMHKLGRDLAETITSGLGGRAVILAPLSGQGKDALDLRDSHKVY